jgi:methylmalonyl-CoA carboxyltransferase 12S subunit
MALNFEELLIAAVLIGVGCVAMYVTMQRAFKQAVSDLRLSTDRQLSALANTVKALETRVAGLAPGPPAAIPRPAAPVAVSAAKSEATIPAAAPTVARKQDEVTPEMLVVIAAAVTAFLGKKVRIRTAKMLQSPYEIVNPWSQQGRVFVQASHNLRSRG